MTERDIEAPSQRTVPAAGTATPAAFPASAFNLAGNVSASTQVAAPHEKTRVQRAIDYVREHGPATNEEIAKAMGIKPGAHPGAYLAVAVKDGRMDTLDGRWHLGPGKRATFPADAPLETELPGNDQVEAPSADHARASASPASIEIYPTDVAIVSRADGSILLAVDGVAVDLTPKQVHLMHAFGAMLAQVGGAR